MAHKTFGTGRKDRNFQITRYFQNSVLRITNNNSKFFSRTTKTNAKNFLWGYERAKIKHDTLCNNFTKGGLKNLDIKHKFSVLRCSWIQRLYNENFHEWRLIPLRYIHKAFDKNLKFYSNLHIPSDLICTFPNICQDIITSW